MIRKKRKQKNSGIIITFLNFVSRSIIKGMSGGFFGKLFTSYDRIEQRAASGVVYGSLTSTPGGRSNSISRRLMKWHDESSLVKILRRAMNFLISSRLNLYGAYFATFGFYSTLIFLLDTALRNGGVISADVLTDVSLWTSVIILILSIPLLASSASLLSVVSNSLTLRRLLEDCAGLSENKFEEKVKVRNKHSYFVAIIAGILTSGLAYLVSPIKIVFVIAASCIVFLFLNFPEMGVLGTIFAAPFLGFFSNPSILLIVMVGITFVSYILKVAVGRRTFTLRLVDMLVILFAGLLLAGGIITSGGKESFASAAMYVGLIIMYFLIVNLLNTKEWLERCIGVVAIPSVIIAAVGILEYTSGVMPAKWIDTDMFSSIANRAVSSFDNPNMLATYMILTIPFIWIYLKRKETSTSGKIIAFLCSLVSILCVVLTWSRGGWLGLIAAIVVFSLITNKHTFKYFLVLGLSSPLWISLLPDDVIGRFTSIGSLADSSTYYRLFTWKGSLKMLAEYFPGGIGVGESAFTQIYPLYSYIGTETTMHSHSLYLEVAIELGVMGILVFAIIMFTMLQRGFGCVKYNRENAFAVISVSAALSGLVAALVHGMFDYVWYNYRVFFMFWVVIAIICAFANVYPKKRAELSENYDMGQEASLDIIFGDEK